MRWLVLSLVLFAPCAAFAQAGAGGFVTVGGNGAGQAVDKSGTITLGGTSQTVMAANTRRVYCEIQPLAADAYIAIDQTASNAQGSFYLTAGSLFKCNPDAVPTGSINIWSATTGAKFTATEYSK